MSHSHLSVRLNGVSVGRLTQAPDGTMSFQYRSLAMQALSLSMPVREEPYDHDACEGYFGGLLPSAPQVRLTIARRIGADRASTFALLQALGADCAGAVSLHDSEEPFGPNAGSPLDADPLTEDELSSLLRTLPEAPFLAGHSDLRLTLAGSQPKLPVCLVNGRPALPRLGTPSTHILKPALPGAEDTTLNEYLCLKLAQAVGLEAPKAELQEAEGLRYLLVTRFDRTLRRDGRLDGIHQEDLCQALGLAGDGEGGPDYKACFDLMMRFGAPARPVARLLRRVVFNVLIGNTGSHAKDYAILHPEDGTPVMAPVYGVVSTRVVPGGTGELAMAIGGERRLENLTEQHWQQFCKDANISYALLKRAFLHVSETLHQAIAQALAADATPEAAQILEAIDRHVTGVMARFQAEGAVSAA